MPAPFVDRKFQDKLTSTKANADVFSLGLANKGQICWETLDDKGPEEPGYDRFFWTARPYFARDALSRAYIECYSDGAKDSKGIPNRVGQIWLFRTQYDWLMQVERDFLMRKHSRIRVEAHAASVKRGIGHDEGPLGVGLLRHIKQIFQIASSNKT